jgi:hypothetical protein
MLKRILLNTALALTLLAIPARAQLLLLKLGNSNLVDSSGLSSSADLPLSISFNFTFDKSAGNLSVLVTNLGGPNITQARLTSFGFNAPTTWGAVSFTSYTGTNGVTQTGTITQPQLTTQGNLFSQYTFNTWLQLAVNGGSGFDKSIRDPASLPSGQTNTSTFVLHFANVNSSSTINFDLQHFFSDNGSGPIGSTKVHDLGLDAQPITGTINLPASDKWVYEFATSDLPPIPEPSTYGLMSVAGLGALVGLRRFRRRASGA